MSKPSDDVHGVLERLRGTADVEVGRGVSEGRLVQVEHSLEMALPLSYRELLRRLGWVRRFKDGIFGVGDDVPNTLDLVALTARERTQSHPRMRRELLPLRHDGGGNFECLYLGTSMGVQNPVVLWEREEGAQQIPGLVAASFVEWLVERVEEWEEEAAWVDPFCLEPG